jgi:3-hydroxybutyryl-CoA dehydrogenase
MELEEIRQISVLGAGIMGHGIAQAFIMAGYPVKLYDIQDSVLETAKVHIIESLELFQQAGLISDEDISAAIRRLVTSTDLKHAVEGSDFIIEAAPEYLDLKQQLFQQVESFCGQGTIIASNTSSLTLKNIGALVKHKDRLVITHWFNPPQIVPAVEVVRGEATSEGTLDTAYKLMQKIKKQPVKIEKELPGFLINRIQMAMVREVFDLYEKGVASAEDIDKAVRGSIGFRLAGVGPLRTADLGGLDVWLNAGKNLLPEIQSSTKTPSALERLVAEGHHGIKTGKGFYEYATDFQKEKLDEAVRARDRDFLARLKDLYWDMVAEE